MMAESGCCENSFEVKTAAAKQGQQMLQPDPMPHLKPADLLVILKDKKNGQLPKTLCTGDKPLTYREVIVCFNSQQKYLI